MGSRCREWFRVGRHFLCWRDDLRITRCPLLNQKLPLTSIHVALGANAQAIGKVEKFRRWFWCGVLGEIAGFELRAGSVAIVDSDSASHIGVAVGGKTVERVCCRFG